jgi:hypothetical protein
MKSFLGWVAAYVAAAVYWAGVALLTWAVVGISG